jgi:L-malate glycosyltransferase
MHILFIFQTFPEPNNQRKGVFYRDQALALQKAGHQVGVIALGGLDSMDLSHSGLRNWKKQTYYIDHGLPVYRALRIPLPLKKKETNLRQWTISAPAARAANLYILKYGIPDILHSQNFFHAGLSGIRVAHDHNLPHILTEHSSNFFNDFPVDKQRLFIKQLPKIDGVYAVSTALANQMRKYVPEKQIRIIKNVVNTNLFSQGEIIKSDSPFIFTIAAQFDSNKNVELPIRAFHKVYAGQENFRLVICGNGPEKKNLAILTGQLGLNNQVDFIEFLPRKELISLYQRSHVVISSSIKETFGLTLVEAMACGIPVIATRSGGPEDFVTDEVGLLVDSNNVKEMSNAMWKIYQNYATFKTQKIRDYCIHNFSEIAFVQNLEKLYNEEKSH